MSQIEIYLATGEKVSFEEWQQHYGLSGDSIGKHFSIQEQKFQQNLREFGHIIWAEPIIKLLDAYREAKGAPVILNSIYRTQAYQDKLRQQGYKAATTSPHCISLAGDVDTDSEEETISHADTLLPKLAKKLGIKARFGYKGYLEQGMTFIHIDTCPEFYGDGGPWADHKYVWDDVEVPDVWKMAYIEW